MVDVNSVGQMDLFNSVQPDLAEQAGSAPLEAPGSPSSNAGTRPDAVVAATPQSKAPTAAVTPGGAIEDAGEELRYNRRNRTHTARKWGDFSQLNDALKVKEITKANVWPKPDYEALIRDGMAPLVAHVVKQAYDSVAAKPMAGRGVLDDVILERYVTTLNRVEQGVMAWANDRESIQKWIGANARIAGAMLGREVALADLVPSAPSLLETVFPEGWREAKLQLTIGGGNKLLSALRPGYDEIRKAIKAIDIGWPRKREAWEVQGFQVMSHPSVVVEPASLSAGGNMSSFLSINDRYVRSFDSLAEGKLAAEKIKPHVLFGKRGFVESFDTEEEAIEAAKTLAGRSRNATVEAKGTVVAAAEREGASRRLDGEDVSTEQLMQTFGLRGVNLGNWMKTPSARIEAQMHLNHAFDAFHDLAEILGVPPKAISLNGMLGLAIGAQGNGGAHAAHFVPGLNEINLTRTTGAGALAHEWAHAADHYFASIAGLATASEPFLSEHARLGEKRSVFNVVDGRHVATEVDRFGELRPEVLAAFKTICETMDKRQQTPDEVAASQGAYAQKITKSLAGWLKSIRRDFAQDEAAFDALANKVMASEFGDGKLAVGRSTFISPVVGEIRDLYKARHGRTYSLENTKALQSWIDSAIYQSSKSAADEVHVPQRVATEFAKNAWSLDQKKGGKPYWSTTLEKFARAFDAFITDELSAKAAKNDYLSFTDRRDETVPLDGERNAINNAFRTLVSDLKVRETEQGTAIFSTGLTGADSLPLGAIAEEISRISKQWPRMPRVTTVKAVAELPFEAPSNADGAFYNGEVFVVAENVADIKQLQKVMAHECIMHYGLEEMLGDYEFSKLHHGIQRMKRNGDRTIGDLAQNVLERYGALPPEIETREIIARAGEQCLDEQGNVKVAFGFMKSVYAGIAGWLRDHGIAIPFSPKELQGIIHDAGAWMKQERAALSVRTASAITAGNTPRLASLAMDPAATTRHEVDQRAILGGAGTIPHDGQFVGRVVHVGGGVLIQKTGRGDCDTVTHEIGRLDKAAAVGQVVEIRYANGQGKLQDRDLGLSVGR